jgi:hypothetical protein
MTERLAVIDTRIKFINEQIDEVMVELSKILTDKTIPLEHRWATYCSAETILEHDKYGPGLECLEDFTLHDLFGTERYETMTYRRLVERIVNAKGRWKDEKECLNTDEFINQMIEEILSLGDGSFSYDW